uniref:Uncharacterized protein n=1 Tax=Chromera velia CCMP2878 TaxID=1169474 RepID=A0A0G4FTL1_9ALVE|eukprot:Cvel_3739.t1-p1 / transcript=Cvel_3739.t1 / gene=Cvel_3739 / organism=Chromera_velia_CCMP2878 / gene_product=Ankyrin-2, putative / transcript_product=Ankyrin-2, putative / location=Cvel_scaffold156:20516-23289(+) / protein_length=432 / sequence_SO=supercontig / SO=protein_coding / is_pseudo=false
MDRGQKSATPGKEGEPPSLPSGSPAASTSAVEEELLGLEGEVLQVLEAVRQKVRVVAHTKRKQIGTTAPPSPPILLPREAVSIERLRELVQTFKRGYHAEIDQIIGCNFKMDLSPLLARRVGSVIRSFQPVSAELVNEALTSFLQGGKQEGHLSDLEMLLHLGAQVDTPIEGRPALISAVYGTEDPALDLQAAELLIDLGGADVNVREKGILLTPLHVACEKLRTEMIRFLLSKDADVHLVDTMQRTAIHMAIDSASRLNPSPATLEEVLDLLISHGADLNALSSFGGTPLALAIKSCNVRLAAFILNKGANVNASGTSGVTALHLAAGAGSPAAVALLLDDNADVHARDRDSRTALHWGALPHSDREFAATPDSRWEERASIARMLICRGIDSSAEDSVGFTAGKIAERHFPPAFVADFCRNLFVVKASKG